MKTGFAVRIGSLALFLLGGCGGAKGLTGAEAKVPMAPPGVYVEHDVADGFAAYKERLTRWGDWSSDTEYGVHWCPRESFVPNGPDEGPEGFHPYRSRGHWDAATVETPAFGAPPGGAYWVSDDAETWGEITTHHGWWVQLDAGQPTQLHPWCWVPGLAETPARVVWRSGGGFVGWAPEPPSWVDDGGEGAFAFFSWSFAMMGALFEPLVRDQCLEGEAQEVAANATSSRAVLAGISVGRFARVGPSNEHVTEARRALVTYAILHPEVFPLAPGDAARRSTSAPAATSKIQSTTKKEDKKEDSLPRATLMVPVMLRDPMLGPVGLTPRFLRPADPVMAAITSSEVSSPAYASQGRAGSSPETSTSTSWTAHSPAVTAVTSPHTSTVSSSAAMATSSSSSQISSSQTSRSTSSGSSHSTPSHTAISRTHK